MVVIERKLWNKSAKCFLTEDEK